MSWEYTSLPRAINKYASFPSIAASNNRLFLVYREAGEHSVNAANDGMPCHHDNESRILFSTSNNTGKTWSTPVEIFKGQFGVNDPAISVLKSGRLLVRVSEIEVKPSSMRKDLTGRFLNHRSDLGEVSAVIAHSVISSDDLGVSWKEPCRLDIGNLSNSLSRDPIVELCDGTLVLAVYESTPFKSEECYLVRSWDQGKSWGDASLIAKDFAPINSLYATSSYNESAIVEASPNNLIALVRCDESYYTNEGEDYMTVGGVGNLRICYSNNNGLSWSNPRKTNIFGQPAAAIMLDGKTLITAYAKRAHPYQICLRTSSDLGQLWTEEIQIKAGVKHWDFGYPSIAIQAGKIFIAYYWQNEKGSRHIEVASIAIEDIIS